MLISLSLIPLPMIVLGALMLKRGWWPQRVGDTPHCPKCDYIITGDQTRCPECGGLVDSKTVTRGERRRRAGLGWTGLVIGVLGLMILVQVPMMLVMGTNWNRYKPLSWLISEMGTGPSPAWQEIRRRLDAGMLSESDEEKIVAAGLPKQRMTNYWGASTVIDYIESRYAEGKLTPAQEQRFFDTVLKIALTVRPVVGEKDAAPYLVTCINEGPNGWHSQWRMAEWQVDDGPAQQCNRASETFTEGSRMYTLAPLGAGNHRLRVKVEFEMAPGGRYGANAAPRRYDLASGFQVVQGEAPIQLVTTPPAEELRASFQPSVSQEGKSPHAMQIQFKVKPLPVDVAFDVLLRYRGGEHKIASIPSKATAWPGIWTFWGNDPEPPQSVDIILRGSEAVARQTVDMTRIWKGEIVLPNVPVQRIGKQGSR